METDASVWFDEAKIWSPDQSPEVKSQAFGTGKLGNTKN